MKKPDRGVRLPTDGVTGSSHYRAAARGAAVQALVAAAVADHDRAAFGAAGGVLLDLERDVRRAQRQGHGARLAVRRSTSRRGRSRRDRWRGRSSRGRSVPTTARVRRRHSPAPRRRSVRPSPRLDRGLGALRWRLDRDRRLRLVADFWLVLTSANRSAGDRLGAGRRERGEAAAEPGRTRPTPSRTGRSARGRPCRPGRGTASRATGRCSRRSTSRSGSPGCP